MYADNRRAVILLRKHSPGRLITIFLLTLLMGAGGGFSIVLLIPALQILNIENVEGASGAAAFFRDTADKWGVEISLGAILTVFIVLLTLTGLLNYFRSILDASYQQSFILKIRKQLFRKILATDWNTLNTSSGTGHLQILTREIPNVAVYYHYLMQLMTMSVTTAVYIAWAAMVSPAFTGIILATGLLLFLILRRYILKSFRLGNETLDSYNRLLKYIEDFRDTVKIAKVHGSEAFYYDKFAGASASLYDLEYRMQKNHSLPQLIQRIAGIMVLAVIIYTGYHSGMVPLSSFFVLILLFSRIFPLFMSLNGSLNMIAANGASVSMVLDSLSGLSDREPGSRAVSDSMPLKHELRLEGVSFSYPGGEQLFAPLTAVIKACSLTGITGPSGIGKTTLIDIIAGLQKPEQGRIMVDGRELTEEMLPQWQNGVGYLPQEPFFIDGTLRENLVWDSREDICDSEIREVLGSVKALHLADSLPLGLDTGIVNYRTRFSGGECQRLALARVLLRRPSLLLLDEATSALDSRSEADIMEVLKGLSSRMTIVLVTHRENPGRWMDAVIRVGE